MVGAVGNEETAENGRERNARRVIQRRRCRWSFWLIGKRIVLAKNRIGSVESITREDDDAIVHLIRNEQPIIVHRDSRRECESLRDITAVTDVKRVDELRCIAMLVIERIRVKEKYGVIARIGDGKRVITVMRNGSGSTHLVESGSRRTARKIVLSERHNSFLPIDQTVLCFKDNHTIVIRIRDIEPATPVHCKTARMRE
jgi:hypothetical protein